MLVGGLLFIQICACNITCVVWNLAYIYWPCSVCMDFLFKGKIFRFSVNVLSFDVV